MKYPRASRMSSGPNWPAKSSVRPRVSSKALRYANARRPTSSRPMMSWWIWVVPSGIVSMRAPRAQRRRHLREHLLHELEAPDRRAELRARSRVRDRHVERLPHEMDAHEADVRAVGEPRERQRDVHHARPFADSMSIGRAARQRRPSGAAARQRNDLADVLRLRESAQRRR